MKIKSKSATDTKRIGRSLSKCLNEGDVVLLAGPLGVGKTVFIKGALGGLGIKEDQVVSPSFTIIREYKKKTLNFYHLDLYRLRKAEELLGLGYQDYCYQPDGITFIEWGQRIREMLPKFIQIDISFLSESKRQINIKLKGYPKDKLKDLNYEFISH